MVLVTGAAGQAGSALVRSLRAGGCEVLASDLTVAVPEGGVRCDLRSEVEVANLFRQRRFSAVVHLAAILPTAFRKDPLTGGEVNLTGSMRLLRVSLDSGVRRFVFGSSASVYGNSARPLCAESAQPAPDEAYGAAKLAIEKILEAARDCCPMETVSLRIARVLGPGAKNTGSPWRSEIFERARPERNRLTIPFAPEAKLSVIHVDDLARALRLLVEAPELPDSIYNTPVEVISAGEVARLAEECNGWRVALGTAQAGPEIDGGKFARHFGFAQQSLAEHMAAAVANRV